MKPFIELNGHYEIIMRRCYFALIRTARFLWRSSVASFIILSMVVPAFAQPPAPNALPTGGQVSAGAASINTSGNKMNITQSSQNAAINWQTFNIGQNAWVNFAQPNSSSIALNRVLSVDPSSIYGTMTANGQVFLLNPAGIIFGPSGSVNVGGLVASTLSLNDSDFMKGNYNFYNAGSAGSIVNQGTLTAAGGGYIALLAPQVTNQGIISAKMGTVAMAAGDEVSLDFSGDGLINYAVNQGTVNALIDNRNLVEADGGQVLMTAKAADSLSSAVVNNEGVIQARTIENKNGVIMLMGDKQNGTVNVSGTLDASAPNGGDGGFIETSAASVNIADGARITTFAPYGKSGRWLIDPADFTIAATGGNMSGATLDADLASNIEVDINSSSGTAGGHGNININDTVTWTQNLLKLTAADNININAVMTASGTASLTLNPSTANGGDGAVAGGTVLVGLGSGGFLGRVDFSGSGTLTINNNGYTVINSLSGLQSMDIPGHYALGSNITGGAFTPVGDGTTPFTGVFDGLGHTVNGLSINNSTSSHIGMFGDSSGTIRNVGLTNVAISATGGSGTYGGWVGGLVGYNTGSISNSYTTGSVSVTDSSTSFGGSNPYVPVGGVGGLAGYNIGSISSSYSASAVSANGDSGNYGGYNIGGLVGVNDGGVSSGRISYSHSTGAVSVTGSGGFDSSGGVSAGGNYGFDYIGGLVGWNLGSISNSYSTGAVSTSKSGGDSVGGLVGYLSSSYSSISNSYSTGAVSTSGSSGLDGVGGLVGQTYDFGSISNSYSAGAVSTNRSGGGDVMGGLVGYNLSTDVSNYTGGVINYTYSTGAINTTNNGVVDTIGGLVGQDVSPGGITKSYWDTTTSGQATSAGGSGLTNSQMLQSSNFSGWGIDDTGGTVNTWRIYNGDTYPLLRSFLTPATITSVGSSITYNGQGFSGGSSVIPGTSGHTFYDGNSQGAVDAGTYNLTVYSDQQGYDFTGTRTGAVTINPEPLTVSIGNVSKTYDGTTGASGTPIVVSGTLYNGASLSGGSYSFTDPNAGNGNRTVTVSGITVSNPNDYTLSDVSNSTSTINPAPLTVTAINGSHTYSGVAFSGGNGVTYSGFVSGQGSSVLGGSLSYSGTSQGAANTGSYSIMPGGLTSGNYSITFAGGTLTINPALLTVTANNASQTYNGLAFSGGSGVTYSGFVNNQTASVLGGSPTYSGTSQGATNAGSYSIIPGGLTMTNSNYAVSFVSGTLTIKPAPLTVTASNASKTYNGLAYSGDNGVTYSGFVNNQTASVLGGALTFSGSSQGATNAGSYSITPGGVTSGNYVINFANGTLTINPAPLLVAANNASETYNGMAYSGGNGVTYSGFMNNQTSSVLGGSLSFSGTSQGATNAGSYSIMPGGLKSGNYSITFAGGTLTITSAPVTNSGSLVASATVTTAITTTQTAPQQTTTTSSPTAPSSAGATGGAGQTSFGGGLITVGTAPAVTTPAASPGTGTPSTAPAASSSPASPGAGTPPTAPMAASPVSTGTSALTAAPVGFTVGGVNLGSMTITDQGGTVTVAAAPSSSQPAPASAASNTGGTSTGALTIYTATDEGTKSIGNFATSTGSGSVSLTQSTAAAPVTVAAAPVTVSGGVKSATFSVTSADGSVLEYSVSQSGNGLTIQPANEAASTATAKVDKKVIAALGMLAAESKLGTSGAQINAVVINEKK